MKILNVQQGSDEWKSIRLKYKSASEAPIIMGVSPHVKRTELMDMKVNGNEREFSAWFEKNILDKGHEIEAKARVFAEEYIGEELYPVTGVSDDDYLLASFDGLTMMGDVSWECKSWNQDKVEAVKSGKVPECDYWQVVHQLIVSGAAKALYTVSDGTEENTVHVFLEPNEADFNKLIQHWKLFSEDQAKHEPVITEVVREGRVPESLPSLRIEVTGEVTASNLAEFKENALAVIESINTDLQTDEDFADADKAVKWCGDVESRVDTAKEHALSQTASIDELFRALDDIKEVARAKRLSLSKLVEARKQAVRTEIRQSAQEEFASHMRMLEERIGVKAKMPHISADFAGAMKGKRTVSSLRDAVSVELARVKIESSEIADRIEINLKTIEAEGGKYPFLFADTQQLAVKENADLKELIKARIVTHQAEEKKKEEAQREKIRLEEEAKARAAMEAEQAANIKAAIEEQSRERVAGEIIDHVMSQPAEPEVKPEPLAEKPRVRQSMVQRKTRPADAEIITLIAMTYRVHESKVIEWLMDMDLARESEKLAASF